MFTSRSFSGKRPDCSRLGANLQTTTNLALPAGSHLVRMQIEDPAVNQSVRVKISGAPGEATNSIWAQPVADAALDAEDKSRRRRCSMDHV